ncbi:MAG: hypothetical protein AAF311_03375 [Pseudomonadota bacterium]
MSNSEDDPQPGWQASIAFTAAVVGGGLVLVGAPALLILLFV